MQSVWSFKTLGSQYFTFYLYISLILITSWSKFPQNYPYFIKKAFHSKKSQSITNCYGGHPTSSASSKPFIFFSCLHSSKINWVTALSTTTFFFLSGVSTTVTTNFGATNYELSYAYLFNLDIFYSDYFQVPVIYNEHLDISSVLASTIILFSFFRNYTVFKKLYLSVFLSSFNHTNRPLYKVWV